MIANLPLDDSLIIPAGIHSFDAFLNWARSPRFPTLYRIDYLAGEMHVEMGDDGVVVPAGLTSLTKFQHWAASDQFPAQGRIDYIAGQIEVDMSAEELFSHNTPKTELTRVLGNRVVASQLGRLFSDRARVSLPKGRLSCEPDLCFVSYKRLESGRVKPRSAGPATAFGRLVVIEGPPDLMVEIVSDSSVAKDTKRLPPAYFAGGVREFWLIDARGEKLRFQIFRRGKKRFQAVRPDGEGFYSSEVLDRRYQLVRFRGPDDFWSYRLDEK